MSPFVILVNIVLVTFRDALHYVRPDNYHVFTSWDVVVELGLLDGT